MMQGDIFERLASARKELEEAELRFHGWSVALADGYDNNKPWNDAKSHCIQAERKVKELEAELEKSREQQEPE